MKHRYLVAACVLMVTGFASRDASACVRDQVANGQTENPTIILTNGCDSSVSWAICINVRGRIARDRLTGITARGASSRVALWLKPGESFTYRFNYGAGAVRSPDC